MIKAFIINFITIAFLFNIRISTNIVSATPNLQLDEIYSEKSLDQDIQIQPSINTSQTSQSQNQKENNTIKIELKQNVAPADAISNDFKSIHKFKYQNQKKINWLEYIEEAKGMSEDIAKLCQDIQISSGTLSQPKQLSYSIFEAEPCKFEMINNMVSALPSDQAKGSPILQRAQISCLPEIILTSISFVIKLALLVITFINGLYSRQNIGVFSCFNLLETLVYKSLLNLNYNEYNDFIKNAHKQLLIQSSELATTIPRILTSECGHSKPLKRQINFPNILYKISQSLFVIQLALLCFVFMLTSQNSFINSLQIQNDYYVKVSYSISCIPITISGIILSYIKYQTKLAIQHARRSILCNLRGFLLNDCYGLDYSDIHGISEGLCYMISENNNKLPSIYFPYISVKDIQVHLEPYKMKELQTIDGKHNERAREILKRGYDTVNYDDILIWIIFQLQNDIKLWLPLSPTQLQNVTYQNSCLFGYTGSELSTLIDMISSQIQDSSDLQASDQQSQKQKFESISQFCRNYHRIRVDHIAEETLHVEQFDKVFIPLEEDL